MKKICLIFAAFFFAFPVLAGTTTVEMLNKLGSEKMVFAKKIVKVNVGDTVLWKATDRGHNVEFIKKVMLEK